MFRLRNEKPHVWNTISLNSYLSGLTIEIKWNMSHQLKRKIKVKKQGSHCRHSRRLFFVQSGFKASAVCTWGIMLIIWQVSSHEKTLMQTSCVISNFQKKFNWLVCSYKKFSDNIRIEFGLKILCKSNFKKRKTNRNISSVNRHWHMYQRAKPTVDYISAIEYSILLLSGSPCEM